MFRTGDVFWYDPEKSVVKTRDDLVRDLSRGARANQEADRPYGTILRLLRAFASGTCIDLIVRDSPAADRRHVRADFSGTDDGDEPFEVRDWIELLRLIDLHADEPTVGMYTSGTTGKPRRVIHSFRTLTRGIRTGKRHASAVWALAYDPSHLAGIQVFLQALMTECPLVFVFTLPTSDLISCLERCEVTHISATPTFYRRLLFSTARPLTGVRAVTCGGEPLDAALIDALHTLFPSARIKNIYALSEAGSLFASDGDSFVIPRTMSGRIDVSSDGELLIHRSLLAQVADEPVGEWYHTGDLVDGIEGGRFRIVNRKSEVINVGGNNVNPHEVEQAILDVEGVGDALVFGRSNRITGNILEARVVKIADAPRDDVLEEHIASHLAGRLPSFKIPRIFRFVTELELTRTGKKGRS